jgi:acyl-CoA dehydrogenase
MSDNHLLAETLDGVLGEHVTHAMLAAAEAGDVPRSLWAMLDDMGLTRATLPESAGGSGLSWHEVAVVAAAVGRHLLPLPLVETLVGASLLARAGLDVPKGLLTIAPALHATLSIREGARGPAVTGACDRVPWGGAADAVVGTAYDQQGATWLTVMSRRDMPRSPRVAILRANRATA